MCYTCIINKKNAFDLHHMFVLVLPVIPVKEFQNTTP